jgi:hypothetical protein
VKFPYLPLPTGKPVYSLRGASVRYRPIIPLEVAGPTGSRLRDCSVDCGSDDTLLPRHYSAVMGIALTSPPHEGEGSPIGGQPIRYPYGRVTFRLSDGLTAYEWEAIVGFVAVPLRWPVLGHAGFLEFFDVELLGRRRQAIITPNASFRGRRIRRP